MTDRTLEPTIAEKLYANGCNYHHGYNFGWFACRVCSHISTNTIYPVGMPLHAHQCHECLCQHSELVAVLSESTLQLVASHSDIGYHRQTNDDWRQG